MQKYFFIFCTLPLLRKTVLWNTTNIFYLCSYFFLLYVPYWCNHIIFSFYYVYLFFQNLIESMLKIIELVLLCFISHQIYFRYQVDSVLKKKKKKKLSGRLKYPV
uniref:Uncharacterized protein n=1 Tax=Cacopsylla melanoneura TaxID=428564 RepID=A0A8D9FJQ1_9HEMI